MAKIRRNIKVAKDFDDMLMDIKREGKETFGIDIDKTTITEKLAKRRPSISDLFGITSNKKKMGKKGQIGDILVLSITFIVIVTTLILMWTVWDGMREGIRSISPQIPETNITVNTLTAAFNGFDLFLPVASILLTIALLGSVALIDTSRIFFVVILIAGVLFMTVVPMMANMVIETLDEPDFADAKVAFSVTYALLNRWPTYIWINIVLYAVAFFARSRFTTT